MPISPQFKKKELLPVHLFPSLHVLPARRSLTNLIFFKLSMAVIYLVGVSFEKLVVLTQPFGAASAIIFIKKYHLALKSYYFSIRLFTMALLTKGIFNLHVLRYLLRELEARF